MRPYKGCFSDEITLEDALPLLAARVAKGPVSKKKVAAKKAAPTKMKPQQKRRLS